MTEVLEFFFDFSSPYGYFAAQKIDALAEANGRTVRWKPILLGLVFKETGMTPLTSQPVRGEYAKKDWQRMARYMDVPWQLPEPFPVATQAAARAFYWIDDRNPDQARLFAKSLYHAYFGEGLDISSPETVADIASALFADKDELLTALKEPTVKRRIRDETAKAIERGVFGSPYIIVDGEGFWGSDRLWMVKKWLQSGGW
ncbi:MAG: 2-hydroxychromene-2-carboxylate isomerase [Rhodospirillaceae bacterium]|nr:2-hydroxychromene-2-carboxylate isomerase [Rhodospirillaceae bacterium]